MHTYPTNSQSFSFGSVTVQLRVPDLNELRRSYEAGAQSGPFPYWAKLWPSAIALCRFITAHPVLVEDKKVLELAAGLGLPGILAAHYASQVTISDYVPDAVHAMTQTVALNTLPNITCRQLDWYALPSDLSAEVLLLSDINYDPSAFEVLLQVLKGFLNKGTTIILTTPQRLMARPFIEQLLPYCIQQEEIAVSLQDEHTFINVLVLRFG
jgi:predicted nicotinamide N-methyase